MTDTFSRRVFIGLLGGALAIPATTVSGSPAAAAGGSAVAYLFGDPLSAVAVGKRCLAQGLVSHVQCTGLSLRLASAQSPAKRLEQMVNEDFSNTNVVVLDGWVLSMTEATVCALAAREFGA